MSMQNIDAQSPEARSADLIADNIARLRALFPELVSESGKGVAINVDVLKALVGDAAVTDATKSTASTGTASDAPARSRSLPVPARCAPARRRASTGTPRRT